MMMPSVFGENLFDEFMNDFAEPAFSDAERNLYGKRAGNLMKTDVKETDREYEVAMDLPGFRKEDLSMRLDQGYLTVRAAKGLDKEEKDQEGRYVRRERYAGSMSRSFYVGDQVTQEDIHAKYEDGILTFRIPKKEKEALNSQSYIAIEG